LHKLDPTRRTAVVAGLLLWLSGGATSADLAAERLLAETFARPGAIDGEVVDLAPDGDDTIAIYRPHQTHTARGGAILLHDSHANADSAAVVRPLRLGLAAGGWHTLSVQLPVAYADAIDDGIAQRATIARRLGAASQWLRERDIRNQVVIAHGDSAWGVLDTIAGGGAAEIRALVLVSSTLGVNRAPDTRDTLADLDLPLFDLVAEHDRPRVLDAVKTRQRWARQAEQEATLSIVAAARPDFPGTTAIMIKAVRAWLAAKAPGRERPR
jgi:hypothetical protein